MLSDEGIAEVDGLRDVATATAFGTTLAVNGLWRQILHKWLWVFSQPSVGWSLSPLRSCGGRNCSRRATVRLGIDTLIANNLVWNIAVLLDEWTNRQNRTATLINKEVSSEFRGLQTRRNWRAFAGWRQRAVEYRQFVFYTRKTHVSGRLCYLHQSPEILRPDWSR